jgi:hypothetical protein
MEDRKKLGRGLEEVSHLFFSGQSARDEEKSHAGNRGQAHAEQTPFLPGDVLPSKEVPETVSGRLPKRGSCWLFCSNHLFAEKAVVACNLALEFARRGFSVGLIETTKEMPTVFFLLGSLLPPPRKRENRRPEPGTLQPTPSKVSPQEPLELIDVSHGYPGDLRAVFIDQDLDCAESVTMLKKLRRETDCLIINVASDISRLRKMITLVDPFIIVPATAYPGELLDSYLLIKQISEGYYCRELGHLIVGEQSYARAEAASSIIGEMARKFLSTNVRFVGMISIEADLPMALLTRTPMLRDAPKSMFSQGIRKMADSLIGNNHYLKGNKHVETNQ